MTSPTQSAMEQQQREEPMQTEREAFEAWAKREGWHDFSRNERHPIYYEQSGLQSSWAAWQAQASELRSLRMTSPTTAAMDLASERLREQAERIRVLEARIAELEGALGELVDADMSWKALHPVLRLQELEKGETRLAAAWWAARQCVARYDGVRTHPEFGARAALNKEKP